MKPYEPIDLTPFPLLEEFYLQINDGFENFNEDVIIFDKTTLKLIEFTIYGSLVDWTSLVRTVMKIGC